MNISESLSSMFLLLIESLYKPDVVMTESVENLLILMRLAHVYDAESTLKACQKYDFYIVLYCFMIYALSSLGFLYSFPFYTLFLSSALFCSYLVLSLFLYWFVSPLSY